MDDSVLTLGDRLSDCREMLVGLGSRSGQREPRLRQILVDNLTSYRTTVRSRLRTFLVVFTLQSLTFECEDYNVTSCQIVMTEVPLWPNIGRCNDDVGSTSGQPRLDAVQPRQLQPTTIMIVSVDASHLFLYQIATVSFDSALHILSINIAEVKSVSISCRRFGCHAACTQPPNDTASPSHPFVQLSLIATNTNKSGRGRDRRHITQ